MEGIMERVPEWLDTLTKISFTDECEFHENLANNTKNIYCLHCYAGICIHCAAENTGHPQLQVIDHELFDAIRENDLKQLVGCENINTFKMIGAKLIILKPKTEPLSENSMRYGRQCGFCGGFLEFLDYDRDLFCSLACKVNAYHKKKMISKILRNYDETKFNFFKSNDHEADHEPGPSNKTNKLKKSSEKEKDHHDKKKSSDTKMKGVAP